MWEGLDRTPTQIVTQIPFRNMSTPEVNVVGKKGNIGRKYRRTKSATGSIFDNFCLDRYGLEFHNKKFAVRQLQSRIG